MRARIHTPERPPGMQHVFVRVVALLLLVGGTVLIIYLEGGHVDSKTGEPPTLLDAVYFTAVTITTVGYGDIVPVSTFARMVDAIVLTPMRLIVFVLFVGLAYELAFKRFQENYRMYRTVQKLDKHYVVCGYGETGQLAVEELLSAGIEPERVVVLDTDEGSLDTASKFKVVTIFGDASKERVLKMVAVERAEHIIVCPGRDDTAVLIALTARDLNPSANMVAMCHNVENARLLRRTGVQHIITSAAGSLLAAATRRPHLVETMRDLLQVERGAYLDERRVTPLEVGKHPNELANIAVVRVYRQGEHFNVGQFPTLETGDVLVFVRNSGQAETPAPA